MDVKKFEAKECPTCGGEGCSVCDFNGTIKTKKKEDQSKVLVNASEPEKDELKSNLGKIQIPNKTAKQEFSAGYTFYKELKEMSDRVEGQNFKELFDEVIDNLGDHELLDYEPVKDTLDVVSILKSLLMDFSDKIDTMAVHFELCVDILSEDIRNKRDEIKELNKELAQKKREVTKIEKEKNRLMKRVNELERGENFVPRDAEVEEKEEEPYYCSECEEMHGPNNKDHRMFEEEPPEDFDPSG